MSAWIFLETISESDQSLNFDAAFSINPLDDAQESTDNIDVNWEEKVSVSGIKSSLVNKVGSSQILPPGGFELVINKRVHVIESEWLRWFND